MRHGTDQVAGWRLGLALGHQGIERVGHVDQVLLANVLGRRVQCRFDVATPVRPQGEIAALFPGVIEQYGQHAGGQFDGDAVNPIKFLTNR